MNGGIFFSHFASVGILSLSLQRNKKKHQASYLMRNHGQVFRQFTVLEFASREQTQMVKMMTIYRPESIYCITINQLRKFLINQLFSLCLIRIQ